MKCLILITLGLAAAMAANKGTQADSRKHVHPPMIWKPMFMCQNQMRGGQQNQKQGCRNLMRGGQQGQGRNNMMGLPQHIMNGMRPTGRPHKVALNKHDVRVHPFETPEFFKDLNDMMTEWKLRKKMEFENTKKAAASPTADDAAVDDAADETQFRFVAPWKSRWGSQWRQQWNTRPTGRPTSFLKDMHSKMMSAWKKVQDRVQQKIADKEADETMRHMGPGRHHMMGPHHMRPTGRPDGMMPHHMRPTGRPHGMGPHHMMGDRPTGRPMMGPHEHHRPDFLLSDSMNKAWSWMKKQAAAKSEGGDADETMRHMGPGRHHMMGPHHMRPTGRPDGMMPHHMRPTGRPHGMGPHHMMGDRPTGRPMMGPHGHHRPDFLLSDSMNKAWSWMKKQAAGKQE